MWHLTIMESIHGWRELYIYIYIYIYIAVIQLIQDLQWDLLSQKHKVKVKSYFSGYGRDVHDDIKPILRHKFDCIILYVGINHNLNLPPSDILKYLENWIVKGFANNFFLSEVLQDLKSPDSDTTYLKNFVNTLHRAIVNKIMLPLKSYSSGLTNNFLWMINWIKLLWLHQV